MPVVLRTNKGNKDLFDEVKNSEYFKDVDMPIVYVLAAVYGCNAGLRTKLEGTEWVTRHEYIARNSQLNRMCQAIAVSSTGSIDILSDEEEVFMLIEEFANSGIVELHNRVTRTDEADYSLELHTKLQRISAIE